MRLASQADERAWRPRVFPVIVELFRPTQPRKECASGTIDRAGRPWDELHLRPAELNLRVPEWTQQTVERIFATHLEDWPALLRSLRLVGDDVRHKARKMMVAQN